jgi:hypothetical protein
MTIIKGLIPCIAVILTQILHKNLMISYKMKRIIPFLVLWTLL